MESKNNIEVRAVDIRLTPQEGENTESRKVEGYAVVWDSHSEDMGFVEIIRQGAITEETIKRSDVLCKYNHDDSKVLARSKYGQGSLTLTLDDKGLRYSFDAPKTALGDELLEHLRRGDIDRSSFAFTLPKNGTGEEWSKLDGKLYRTIYRIEKLYDVSPVWTPAYDATSVSARSNSQVADDMIDKAKKLDTYHQELRERVKRL